MRTRITRCERRRRIKSNLASAVIAAGDKFVARFVESAICQRQDVRPQNLEKKKVAAFVCFQLFNKLIQHSPKVWFLAFGNQRLFENNLIYNHINISAGACEGVNRRGF